MIAYKLYSKPNNIIALAPNVSNLQMPCVQYM